MLTRAADYAARVMIHLATLPRGTRVQRTVLAEVTSVPDSFLSKVLQGLVRARLIASRPGVNGGFELTAAPENVTLLEVVEAIDGPIALNICVSSNDRCERQAACAAHPVWLEAQQAVVRVLQSASLAKLAEQAKIKATESDTGGGEEKAVSSIQKCNSPQDGQQSVDEIATSSCWDWIDKA